MYSPYNHNYFERNMLLCICIMLNYNINTIISQYGGKYVVKYMYQEK